MKSNIYTRLLLGALTRSEMGQNLTVEQIKRFVRASEKKAADEHNGDVIKVKRWHGVYHHYGVYAISPFGQESVIHYTTETGNDFNGIVLETPLEVFLDGSASFSVCNFNSAPNPHIYSGEETVRRARSLVGLRGYNLISNNCEHFATYCKTGKKSSSQSDTGIHTLIGLVIVTFATLGISYVV